ncbi:hypothetical protein AMJ57_04820 [Parcubacteria bacterium SG8_24]|nr:MAG: hypothetical protein AMJ57_04820 [Parcubacteria bacterium SG8_24]
MLDLTYIILFISTALAFLLLCLMNRALGLAVLCALLPTYLLRLTVPLPGTAGFVLPTTLLEVLFLELFVFWFFTRRRSRLEKRLLGPWIYPATLLLVGATIGTLMAPDILPAAGLYRAYFVEPFLFFLVFTDIVRGRSERRLVLGALGATVAVIGVTAIFQKLTGFGIPNPLWQAEETRRVTGFFGFPNALGLFSAPVTVLMVGWSVALIRSESLLQRTLSLLPALAAALGILAILFAVSEGAAVGLAAGLALLGLLMRPTRLLTALLLIAASATIIFHQPTQDYVSLMFSLRDESGGVRRIVWDESVDMLADRPIFGAGMSAYRSTLPPYHEARHIEIFMYPHNFGLNFWSETGLIGLLGFIWLAILFLLTNSRIRSSFPDEWLPTALIAAMIAILVHGIVDVPYLKNDLAFQFWILLGLTESMRRQFLVLQEEDGD